MAEPQKSKAGFLFIGFGVVLEIVAIILLVLNIRKGSPPIPVAMAILVAGTMMMSIGATKMAKGKR